MDFRQRNALVASNLPAFGRIVAAKYASGQVGDHRTLPLVTVTASDI
jgi:hypothetical protein